VATGVDAIRAYFGANRARGAATLVGGVFTLSGDRIARVAIYGGPQVTDTSTA
jgi:hypothetical protein